VVAIDLSAPMLGRARARLARCGIRHVRLCRMDAAWLAFPSSRFDAVYAPYVLNAVPDPVRVATEMLRVCRSKGRIVLLNHFERLADEAKPLERFVGQIARRLTSLNWHLQLEALLKEAGLTAQSIERVNAGRVSTLVVCRGD
jgi:phosphatidylethanolamine/phosphatidyl-N-methylethanolamine N-methyltransferase